MFECFRGEKRTSLFYECWQYGNVTSDINFHCDAAGTAELFFIVVEFVWIKVDGNIVSCWWWIEFCLIYDMHESYEMPVTFHPVSTDHLHVLRSGCGLRWLLRPLPGEVMWGIHQCFCSVITELGKLCRLLRKFKQAEIYLEPRFGFSPSWMFISDVHENVHSTCSWMLLDLHVQHVTTDAAFVTINRRKEKSLMSLF